MKELQGLYSIFDRVAEEYGPPMACKNDGIAFRAWMGEMEKVPAYAKEDYWLLRVAQWDPETGKVIAEKVPVRIEKAVNDE